MNLLLFREVDVDGVTATINGPRAGHIKSVLKKGPGEFLRAGVAGRGRCSAEILTLNSECATFRLGPLVPVPPPRVHVIVALQRPKALSRLVSAAASFGLRSLSLINAWKVEKSYFASPRLKPERLAEDVLLGCEQGAQVWIPEVQVFRRFVPFFETGAPQLFPAKARKLLLDPHVETTIDQVLPPRGSASEDDIVVAFGPEGGFVAQEIQSFQNNGFLPVRINSGPLKTEVALAATLGQLALLCPTGHDHSTFASS